MKKLSAVALVLAVLGVYAPGASHALSCVAPTMNEGVVEGADIVFEGTAGPTGAPTRAEKAALDAAGIATTGGGIAEMKVFEFTVTKGWKGAAEGQRIRILRNTYWGDMFAAGETYLVVGDRQIDDLYVAPLCGNTMHICFAAQAGHLKTLERLIGVGVPIGDPPWDAICGSNAE